MAIQGNLETFYLPNLLQLLSNDKKTGILQLSEGEDKVEICFKEGTIISATGSKNEERLGYHLRSEGIIGNKELNNCLQIARDKNQKLGKVLLEKSLISTEHLEKFLGRQIELILYNLFLWEKGDFVYNDTNFDPEEEIITNLDTLELILEASRRVDEISVIGKQLPSNKEVLILSERVYIRENVKLKEREGSILLLIDGKRTLKEVILESGYDKFEVYKIIYSLISSGLVEKIETLPIESSKVKSAPESTEENLVVESATEGSEENIVLEPAPKVTEEKFDLEPAPEIMEEKLVMEPVPEESAEKRVTETAPEITEEKPVMEPVPEESAEKRVTETAPEITEEKLIMDPAPEESIIVETGPESTPVGSAAEASAENLANKYIIEAPPQEPEEEESEGSPAQERYKHVVIGPPPAKIKSRSTDIKEEKDAETKEVKLSTGPSQKRFIIAGAIAGIFIIAGVSLFFMRPVFFQAEPTPSKSEKQITIEKKIESAPIKKTPKQSSAEPGKASAEEPVKAPVADVKKEPVPKKPDAKTKMKPVHETTYYQDPHAYFSLNLPKGYTILDKSAGKKKETFITYPPNINITITSKKAGEEWDSENEMYNRIMSIREGKDPGFAFEVDRYGPIEFGGGKGYEITLSGSKKSIATKVQSYVVASYNKIVYIDIVCRNWRTSNVNKLFNQIKKSIVKTLLVYP